MRREVVTIGQRLAQRGMVAGTDGNISVRLDADRILITPSGVAKGYLTAEDLVLVDISGKKLQGKPEPSTEMRMHLFVYQNRPEIQACVHAHPPYSTSFAVAGLELPDDILPEVVLFVGKIPLTDYAPPGTDEVPRSLAPHIESTNAFLLRNHGLLTIGRSLDEAYNRMETVEQLAKITHLARQLGAVNSLPSDDFCRLEKIRTKLDQVWKDNS